MSEKLILVTGGAGHVGSHVIEQLAADGHCVISLDNYFNGSEANHIDHPDVEYRRGDTNDIFDHVPETPDVIYHLGEYARISPSHDEEESVTKMNILGTLAVTRFSEEREVGKLVYAASSTKFANQGRGSLESPYAMSKAHNVALINECYGRERGLPYAICYFYNAFGPRENGNGRYATVIAKFQDAYLRGEPLPVTLPGDQKRNFTYVEDLARGLILVGEKGVGDGYALNNIKSYSIREIAEAFETKIEFKDGRPGRTDSGDAPTKARELGWETTVDIIPYIKKFIRENRPGSKV